MQNVIMEKMKRCVDELKNIEKKKYIHKKKINTGKMHIK